jgi:hypothetical protein
MIDEHVARMGKWDAYRVLCVKPYGRNQLGRPGCRSDTEMGLKYIRYENVDRIHAVKRVTNGGLLWTWQLTFRSIKDWDFLHPIGEYLLLKDCSTAKFTDILNIIRDRPYVMFPPCWNAVNITSAEEFREPGDHVTLLIRKRPSVFACRSFWYHFGYPFCLTLQFPVPLSHPKNKQITLSGTVISLIKNDR